MELSSLLQLQQEVYSLSHFNNFVKNYCKKCIKFLFQIDLLEPIWNLTIAFYLIKNENTNCIYPSLMNTCTAFVPLIL